MCIDVSLTLTSNNSMSTSTNSAPECIKCIEWLKNVGINDKSLVGGKNASLGEMYQNLTPKGIRVPNAFLVTTKGFAHFVDHNDLQIRIQEKLAEIQHQDLVSLRRTGLEIRLMIQDGDFPEDLETQIIEAYTKLSAQYTDVNGELQEATDVAVRSSSTAEDLQGKKIVPPLVSNATAFSDRKIAPIFVLQKTNCISRCIFRWTTGNLFECSWEIPSVGVH